MLTAESVPPFSKEGGTKKRGLKGDDAFTKADVFCQEGNDEVLLNQSKEEKRWMSHFWRSKKNLMQNLTGIRLFRWHRYFNVERIDLLAKSRINLIQQKIEREHNEFFYDTDVSKFLYVLTLKVPHRIARKVQR